MAVGPDFLVERRGFEPLTSAVSHTASRFSLYGFMRFSDKKKAKVAIRAYRETAA